MLTTKEHTARLETAFCPVCGEKKTVRYLLMLGSIEYKGDTYENVLEDLHRCNTCGEEWTEQTDRFDPLDEVYKRAEMVGLCREKYKEFDSHDGWQQEWIARKEGVRACIDVILKGKDKDLTKLENSTCAIS